MFNIQFIFITVLLLLFVAGTVHYKIPRASVPLFIIYIYFVFISDTMDNLETTEYNAKQTNSVRSKNTDLSIENNNKSNDILVKPIKPTFEPKPLTFDLDSKTNKNKNKRIEKIEKAKKTKTKQKIEKESTLSSSSELVLKDIKICKNISKRTPVGSDIIFKNDVDSLYCYSLIKNPGDKKEIKHAWYYESRLMTQVRYNIKRSNTYRSWTKKTILPSQIGNWRVDIHDNNGTIIGSKKFKIVKIEN
jgi:hypothetical protein